jgi:hypothetical protein
VRIAPPPVVPAERRVTVPDKPQERREVKSAVKPEEKKDSR